MLKKLNPANLKELQNAEFIAQVTGQEVQRTAPKSEDPKNFPVFEIPAGERVLVYVPNHTVKDENGNDVLRMDRPLLHTGKYKNRFITYRCISGLVNEALGYDGTCPLCEGENEPWELANKNIEAKCAQAGLNPSDKDNESVKTIRTAEFNSRALRGADRYVTFPIVVFDTETANGRLSIKVENKKPVYRVMWYSCSENVYTKKWLKAVESYDDGSGDGMVDLTSIGGLFYKLDYGYSGKGGESVSKRDAARDLTIQIINYKGESYDLLKKKLDEETKGWTPEKAMETVIANHFYNANDLSQVADGILEETRTMLALYAVKNGEALPEAPAFTPIEAGAGTPTLQAVGETDADLGIGQNEMASDDMPFTF